MSAKGDSSSFARRNREAIEATAGVWLSLRDRGLTPQETEAFVRWLAEDPDHAATFAALEQTWRKFDKLAAIVAPSASTNPDVLAPRFRRRISKLPFLSMAAAAVLALGAAAWWRVNAPRHFAETAVGVFQKIDLPDGSIAQLNTDSAIDVDFSQATRRVRLVRGEVHFSVRKDPQRPFLVTVDRVQVRAVGTAFDVRERGTTTEVVVTDGRVQLLRATTGEPILPATSEIEAPPLLVAGERAIIPNGDRGAQSDAVQVSQLSENDLKRVLAWHERMLEFDATPLAEVVTEFNRYNRVKLVVADPTLGARTFSGTFRADGYETLIALLEQNFGVNVSRERDTIRLRPR